MTSRLSRDLSSADIVRSGMGAREDVGADLQERVQGRQMDDHLWIWWQTDFLPRFAPLSIRAIDMRRLRQRRSSA